MSINPRDIRLRGRATQTQDLVLSRVELPIANPFWIGRLRTQEDRHYLYLVPFASHYDQRRSMVDLLDWQHPFTFSHEGLTGTYLKDMKVGQTKEQKLKNSAYNRQKISCLITNNLRHPQLKGLMPKEIYQDRNDDLIAHALYVFKQCQEHTRALSSHVERLQAHIEDLHFTRLWWSRYGVESTGRQILSLEHARASSALATYFTHSFWSRFVANPLAYPLVAKPWQFEVVVSDLALKDEPYLTLDVTELVQEVVYSSLVFWQQSQRLGPQDSVKKAVAVRSQRPSSLWYKLRLLFRGETRKALSQEFCLGSILAHNVPLPDIYDPDPTITAGSGDLTCQYIQALAQDMTLIGQGSWPFD